MGEGESRKEICWRCLAGGIIPLLLIAALIWIVGSEIDARRIASEAENTNNTLFVQNQPNNEGTNTNREQLTNDISNYTDELAKLRTQNNTLIENNNILRAQLSAAKIQITSMQTARNQSSALISTQQTSAEQDQALVIAQQSLARAQQTLAERNQTLAERDQALAAMQQSLTKQGQNLANMQQSLAERDLSLATTQEILAKREQDLAIAQAKLQSAGQSPTELQEALAERNQALLVAQQNLAKKDQAIAQLTTHIETATMQVLELQTTIGQEQSKNKHLKQQTEQQTRLVTKLEEQRNSIRNDVIKLEKALTEKEKKLHDTETRAAQIEESYTQAQQQIREANKQIGVLSAIIESEKNRHQEKITQLMAEMKQKNHAFQQTISNIDISTLELQGEARIQALVERMRSRLKASSLNVGALGHCQSTNKSERTRLSSKLAFKTGQTQLSQSGQAALDKIAAQLTEELKNHPDESWRLIVEGHTDKTPIVSRRYPSNWELSALRAAAVVRYLATKGLDPERMIAVGRGSVDPIDPGDHPKAHEINRRIEIHIASEL